MTTPAQEEAPPPPYAAPDASTDPAVTPTIGTAITPERPPPPSTLETLTPRQNALQKVTDKLEALSGTMRVMPAELRAISAAATVNEVSAERVLSDARETISASLRAVTAASSPSRRRTSASTSATQGASRPSPQGVQSRQPRSSPISPPQPHPPNLSTVSAGLRHLYAATEQTTLYIDSIHSTTPPSPNYTHRISRRSPTRNDPPESLFTAVAAGKTYDAAPFLSLSRATGDKALLQILTLEPSFARARRCAPDGTLPTEVWLRQKSAVHEMFELEVRFKNAFRPPLRVFRNGEERWAFTARCDEHGVLRQGALAAADGSIGVVVDAAPLVGRAEIHVAPRFDLLLATDIVLAAMHLAASTSTTLAPSTSTTLAPSHAREMWAPGGVRLGDALQVVSARGPLALAGAGPSLSSRRMGFVPDHLR